MAPTDSYLPTSISNAYASATAPVPRPDPTSDDENDGAEGGQSALATFFEEADDALGIVRKLTAALNAEDEAVEVDGGKGSIVSDIDLACDRLRLILEKYQEQPHLLDPHIESLITPAVESLRSAISRQRKSTGGVGIATAQKDDPKELALNRVFRYLNVLMKVRGAKTVIRFFSHEVADLEPVFEYLSALDPDDRDAWQTRYVLLLWLSIIVMIPFDLMIVDSGHGSQEESLVVRMTALGKRYLSSTGKEHEAAAILLMRLLTRRDVQTELEGFLQWAASDGIKSEDVFELRGVLYALCMLYKHGSRAAVMPTLSGIFPIVCGQLAARNSEGIANDPRLRNSAMLRKLVVKLTQRIGLCYLKPKVAKWRYQRGHRSLARNLAPSSSTADATTTSTSIQNIEDDEEDDDVPEEIEEVIDAMLSGLSDRDTVVRWSAAKGLGRLTDRLPQELAQQVIDSVLSSFADNAFEIPDDDGREGNFTRVDLSGVSDAGWHGACLAMAELARRGLLLPKKLAEVIPWILRALHFDVRRGSHSIGAHVRDAACYVCWAFARAYSPEIIAPHVPQLARSLVVVSCYDREVNIRRAASAAFQENVGRLGLFPHGIDIITAADYFAVGSRPNAFLEVGIQIAKFDEYRQHIIRHVARECVCHWDRNIRGLASKTLYRLTFADPEFVIQSVLPNLISRQADPDLVVRHGSLLSIAEIALAWSRTKRGLPMELAEDNVTGTTSGTDPWWSSIDEDNMIRIVKPVSAILPFFPAESLDTFGSDMIRIACCRLIECLSQSEWPLSIPLERTWWEAESSVVSTRRLASACWNLVDTSLSRREESVQAAGAEAIKWLSRWDDAGEEVYKDIVKRYLKMVDPKGGSARKFHRRGFALGLGMLEARKVLAPSVEAVVTGLVAASAVQDAKLLNDAESRRNAVIALANITVSFGSSFKAVVSAQLFNTITNAFFEGLVDYSTDSRGDVGSWVREVSLRGLEKTILAVHAIDQQDGSDATTAYVDSALVTRLVGNLIQQSVEKIDKMRETAGRILMNIIWWDGEMSTTRDGLGKSFALKIRRHEELRQILPKDHKLNWLNPSEVYPSLIRCLELEEYRDHLLTGLVVSIGGLTESLVRSSSASLVAYLATLADGPVPDSMIALGTEASTTLAHPEPMSIGIFFGAVLRLFRRYQKQDRVSAPLLETLDVLFGCGAVARAKEPPTFYGALYEVVRKEVAGTRDVRKLLSGINVFAGFVVLNDGEECHEATVAVRARVLKQLIAYLAHPFPKIRRTAAETLYLVVSTAMDLDILLGAAKAASAEGEPNMSEAEDILLTTDWDMDVQELRAVQHQFAKALLIDPPKTIWK